MSLIAIAVYDTVENNRTELTIKTIESLLDSIDFVKHRLFVIDNGSCQKTKDFLQRYNRIFTVINNETNLGTAKAINQAWKLRGPAEHLIKMDNDCIVYSDGWVNELEAAIERDPEIGILGLKRKDLLEDPNSKDPNWKTTLRMLPHKQGERWIIVEDAPHIMGTCQMYNYRLIDQIGGLYQMDGIYGFDDSLAAIRCQLAGFKNCFLPHIEIDHIDPGGDLYTKEKQDYAGKLMARFNHEKELMKIGEKDIYYPL